METDLVRKQTDEEERVRRERKVSKIWEQVNNIDVKEVADTS